MKRTGGDRLAQLAVTKAFATSMRRIRNERRMSAAHLADLVTQGGIPIAPSMIGNLEIGRRQQVGLDEAHAVATVLQTTLGDMIEDGQS